MSGAAARDGNGSDDSLSESNPLYSHPYYSPVKVRPPCLALQADSVDLAACCTGTTHITTCYISSKRFGLFLLPTCL